MRCPGGRPGRAGRCARRRTARRVPGTGRRHRPQGVVRTDPCRPRAAAPAPLERVVDDRWRAMHPTSGTAAGSTSQKIAGSQRTLAVNRCIWRRISSRCIGRYRYNVAIQEREEGRGDARVRRPRPAARIPDARLRAAQAAQRSARRSGRAFSYGSLYPRPCAGSARLASRTDAEPRRRRGPGVRAARGIVYKLTAEGKERFQQLLAEAGRRPRTTRTSACTSRSSRAPTPAPGCGSSKAGAPARGAPTSAALDAGPHQASGSTATRSSCNASSRWSGVRWREVRWLNELIESERAGQPPSDRDRPTERPAEPRPSAGRP